MTDYPKERERYRQDVEHYKCMASDTLSAFPWWRILFAAIGVCGVLGAVGLVCSMGSDAAATAQKELSASALLHKYEWLKEAHAQLEKKAADIGVYKASRDNVAAAYGAAPRSQWARDDRDAYNQRATELAGVVASYNDLAAQYNAKMAEVNWRFTNVGQLPQGATEPLPRDYAPYRTE